MSASFEQKTRWSVAAGLLLVFWAGAIVFGGLSLGSLRIRELAREAGVTIGPDPAVVFWFRLGTALLMFIAGPLMAWDVLRRQRPPRARGGALLLANVVVQWLCGTVVGWTAVSRMDAGAELIVGLAIAIGLPLWATLLYLTGGTAPSETTG